MTYNPDNKYQSSASDARASENKPAPKEEPKPVPKEEPKPVPKEEPKPEPKKERPEPPPKPVRGTPSSVEEPEPEPEPQPVEEEPQQIQPKKPQGFGYLDPTMLKGGIKKASQPPARNPSAEGATSPNAEVKIDHVMLMNFLEKSDITYSSEESRTHSFSSSIETSRRYSSDC